MRIMPADFADRNSEARNSEARDYQARDYEDRSREKPDWPRHWALVRRRLWHLVLPFFGVWFLLWCVSWLLPAMYRSSTLILIEQPTVSQQYVVSNVASNIEERLESIKEQILSRTLLLRIIDKLNLYPSERARSTPDDLVDRMRKNIDIDLTRSAEHDQLTAFNICFSSDNPYVAQQVTTELTNILISENLEVRQEQSQNTTAFLQSQLDSARQNLAAQEQRVREFKDKHLGDLPGQLQSNIQILSGLQTQLQHEQDALGRAKQQNAYLESLLGQFRSGKPGGSAATLSTLDEELNQLRSDLADLSSRYTDQHPDVRKVKEQIARTQKMRDQMALQLRASAGIKPKAGESDAEPDYNSGKSLPPQMEVESQLKANQTRGRQPAAGDWRSARTDRGLPVAPEPHPGAGAGTGGHHPRLRAVAYLLRIVAGQEESIGTGDQSGEAAAGRALSHGRPAQPALEAGGSLSV